MSGVDHVRFYSSKWRSGCLMLSLEAEGLYIRIASFRWDAGVRVPSDRKKAALLLRINYNKYTKVLDELFTAKLVIDNGDGLVIERAEIEYQAAEDAIRDKARRVPKPNGNGAAGTPDQGCEGQTSDDPVKDTGQPAPQVTPPLTGLVTPPTASENHQGNQRPSIDKDSREGIDVVGDGAREVSIDRNELAQAMKRITDAAKPVLRDGGMSSGLMGTSSEIAKWLKAGCDIDADVLPVIQAVVAKGAVVSSWKLFSPLIIAAKASRETPLPDAVAKPTPSANRPRKTFATYDTLMQQVTGAPAS